MKKLTILLICYLGLTVAHAQQSKSIKQLNGKTVAVNALTTRLAHIVDSAKIAGLQVAIINQDQLVWTKNFGFKDVEKQLKMDDHTAMYAASFTKVVSAYLFLSLVDKGIFNLDQPIRNYLKMPIGAYPKWKDLGDDTLAFNKITARMLLSHSSGMPVLRSLYNNSPKLIAKPGEKFYYSNEGINLLGFIMEEYTGKKLEVLAKEEVFIPLQMNHTSMVWEPAFESNFSFAYFKDGKKYGSERRESARAAGSMTTTATDYSKLVINMMKNKGLSKALYAQMLSPQIALHSKRGFGPLRDSLTTENDKIALSWGIGTGLFKSPYGPAFFHSGHGDANQNYFVAFPDKGIAIVLMSNSENFESVSSLILNACLADRYSPVTWLGHLGN